MAKLFPAVGAMLRDGDSRVRLDTMHHLDGLESRFTKLVPTLIDVLDDKDLDTRCFAARCISRMGAAANEALPRLKQLMNSAAAVDAVVAAAALAKIDPKIDVVSRLRELLNSTSEHVSPSAVSLLMQLEPKKAAPAMPTLLAMLNHKKAGMRVTAAHAIGALTPRDEAIDMLTQFVKKEKDQAAKMTMARIVLRLRAGVGAPQLPSGGNRYLVAP